MLNLLVRIIIAVSVLVGIVLLIGTLLPREYETTNSIEIPAAPGDVFPFLVDLQEWQLWSPWNADTEGLRVTLGDRTSGVGATQTWTEPRGEGSLVLTEVVDNERVLYRSEFANFPELTGTFQLTEIDPQRTRVTWQTQGALPGGPFYGWFGMMFSTAMQGEYQKSLTRLKQHVESVVAQEPDGTATEPPQSETVTEDGQN